MSYKAAKKQLWFMQILSNPYTWVAIGVLVLLLLMGGTIKKVIERILVWFGLKEGENTSKVKGAISGVNSETSPWHPDYYKKHPGTIFTQAKVNSLISDIWSSFGLFNDDEEKAIGAIKQCVTKQQLSWLCAQFYEQKKADLLVWLRGSGVWPQDRLSDEDLAIITDYANTLKDG